MDQGIRGQEFRIQESGNQESGVRSKRSGDPAKCMEFAAGKKVKQESGRSATEIPPNSWNLQRENQESGRSAAEIPPNAWNLQREKQESGKSDQK